MVNETWDVFFDGWPCSDGLEIPGKLVSVSVFEWTTTTGTSSWTVSGTDLSSGGTNQAKVETGSPAAIRLLRYKLWPTAILERGWPIRVRAVIGHGATANDVPMPLRHATALLAAHFLENREATTDQRRIKVPFSVDRLIERYRRA